MRLGKVRVLSEYVVDLDNKEMIAHAKDALYADFSNAIIHSSYITAFDAYFEVIEAPELSESDITEFLKDEEEMEDEL